MLQLDRHGQALVISFSFLEQSKTDANDSSFHARRWHPLHRFLRISTLNPITSKGLFINKSLSSTWMSLSHVIQRLSKAPEEAFIPRSL